MRTQRHVDPSWIQQGGLEGVHPAPDLGFIHDKFGCDDAQSVLFCSTDMSCLLLPLYQFDWNVPVFAYLVVNA